MPVWALFGVVLLLALMSFCYYGSGIILHPPKMNRLGAFPEQYGLPYEKVSFKTRDGLTLRGWFIPSPRGPDEERTLVLCHGWGDNKGDLLKITNFLNHAAGFNLLYFDNRSHGESDGEITTIGYLETIDFDAAVDFLREKKPHTLKRLGVFGMSMGAAVATLCMPKHPEVKAAVLESPFTNYREVVRQWAWNHFHLPYFPFIVLTLFFLRLRVGHGKVDSYHPIRAAAMISPRPLLVIGGSLDELMPEREVRAFYAAAKEPKQLWIIPGARHSKCHDLAGIEYEARVAGFFNRYL
ncbi:MAG: alpha/beta fold hydrolase [Elusimicrobia bacterium]|nr:alpha/beta fold hydrolase [Elusimicrobiota bacterium]